MNGDDEGREEKQRIANDDKQERLLKTTSKQGLINLCKSLREQLAKERELRKELVESLIYISKTLGGLTLPQDEPEALAYNEALKAIKKGT